MSSAWNWIGIFAWLLVLAYFFWVINNVHSRKKYLVKTALSNRRHALAADVASRNFEITAFEVVVLVVALFGMGRLTFHHHVSPENSAVSARVVPLDYTHSKQNPKHPNRKIHYYYVKINRSRALSLAQKYHFTIGGQYSQATSRNAIVTTRPERLKHDLNFPVRVHRVLVKKLAVANHSHRAWALQVVTTYKNRFINGLGLHAGQKKFVYTILRVPKRSEIYVNRKSLHKNKRLNRAVK